MTKYRSISFSTGKSRRFNASCIYYFLFRNLTAWARSLQIIKIIGRTI